MISSRDAELSIYIGSKIFTPKEKFKGFKTRSQAARKDEDMIEASLAAECMPFSLNHKTESTYQQPGNLGMGTTTLCAL